MTTPSRTPTQLIPSNTHPQLGRLTHYAFDAVLLSAFLAGVKRSTGLTYVQSISPSRGLPVLTLTFSPSLKSESLTESPGIRGWIDRYLWMGETVMDQSVAIMGSSGYFERKR